MGLATIIYKKNEHVATLTLNRPEVMNAINTQMASEIGEALVEFKNDPEAWVLIITGAGDKAFSAGRDLKEKIVIDRASPEIPSITQGTIEIWKPIIAAINGMAIGAGIELAMACDVRLIVADAQLGLMEPKRGLMPGGGGCVRLPRLVPLSIAMEMLLSGDLINAQEAYRIGLVNQVVPFSELMPAVQKMADRFLECAPLALRTIKETAMRALDLPMKDALRARFGIDPMGTEDAEEGIAAFKEKRKPVWQSK